MTALVQRDVRTFPNNSAIAPFLRVKLTGGFLAVREHVAAVMTSKAGKEHVAAYPPFAETGFAKLLQKDMAKGKSVLLECYHRVPAAAMADWRNLRGVDLELAKLALAPGGRTVREK